MDYNTIINLMGSMVLPVVLVICLVVGAIMKNFMPTDNKIIPTVLCVIGVILACWYLNQFTVTAIAAGAVTGWAAVGLYEMVTQYAKAHKIYPADEAVTDSRKDIEKHSDEAVQEAKSASLETTSENAAETEADHE